MISLSLVMALEISSTGTSMKEFKVRQYVYNRLHPLDDLIEEHEIVLNTNEDIVRLAVNYFNQDLDKLYFPAKSYSVAIIYSYLLDQNFGEDFYLSLNDPDLLGGNDKFFVPYSQDQANYDAILKELKVFSGEFKLQMNVKQVAKTVEYFQKEFLS